MHMLSANSLPLRLEMPSVPIGARSHSHQNAAVVDTSFILFGTLFRDAPIAKRSNKATRQASDASGPQCHSYRPRENQAQEIFARMGRPGQRAIYGLANLPRTYRRADIEAMCERLHAAQCVAPAGRSDFTDGLILL